jgi:predicted acetyltransferase
VTLEVKPVPASETRRWFEAVMTSFGEELTEEQWALEQKTIEPARVLGVYDGPQVVGGGAAFSFQMTVPGGSSVPTAGVTMVGVMPTHRRQGGLRKLMARQLADVRISGEALAALWASEGSIYQRFGYGLATLSGSINIARDRAVLRREPTGESTVRLVDPAEARPHMERIYDAVRRVTPGFYARHEAWWHVFMADPEFRRRGAGRKFHAVYFRDGEAAGYVVYRIKEEWGDAGPDNALIVVEILAIDTEATQQLWRYVFGVDLMASIRWRLGPADHPLLLLLTEPRRLQLRVTDGMWLRIVDVPAALRARSYGADGSIVLEVTDEFMPEVAGRWRLTASNGRGNVEPTTDAADLALEIQDLGALYMGAFSLASLGRAGRTVELSEGVRARADAIFASTALPWCPEVF